MENNSLYHHGIKGQKWGERRWQYNDGTLTPAGKKRYAKASADAKRQAKADEKAKARAAQKEKLKAKADEVAAKRKAAEEATAKKKAEQKPKELTPEEKKAKVLYSRSAKALYENRQLFDYNEMEKQRQLLELDGKVKSMIVEEPSKVEKFLTKAGSFVTKVKDVAVPAIDTITKFTDMMEKLDPEAKARKAAKEQAEVDTKRNEARLKKLAGDKTQAETNTENEKTRKAKAEADEAESRLKKKPDENSDTGGSDETNSSNTGGSGNGSGPVKGTVIGGGNSSKNKGSSGSSKEPRTIWDVDWEDITPSKEAVNFIWGMLESGSNITLPSSSSSSTLSGLLGSVNVNSLPPASSSTENTIAGLLAPPKKEDD